ncbi:MAG: hypothetical protein JRE28_00030 [Deltaproteobacteria bacterium]|nr:hypothetical protein [Deltaproteobacteria bacterium]
MKNFIMFIITLILFVTLIGSGIASDLSQRINSSETIIITSDSPNQKIKKNPLDTIQVLDKNKLDSETLDLARRGCCSHHGGVCGCDEATDRIICCDGTLSPSCTCSGY